MTWCWRSSPSVPDPIRPTLERIDLRRRRQSDRPGAACRRSRACISAACRRWRCSIPSRSPSTTVSFNTWLPDVPLREWRPRTSQRAVDELHMPEGIRGSFDGNAGDFNKTALSRQPLLDPVARWWRCISCSACSMRAWSIR